MIRFLVCVCSCLCVASAWSSKGASADERSARQLTQPTRFSFRHRGGEREYFVRLPEDYDSSQVYRGLVAFHGGGGNGRDHWLVRDMHQAAIAAGLSVVVISPTGSRTDPNEQRFPSLGDGLYLQRALTDVRKRYRLHPKILITGYSRGAQFAHRFALQNPDLVHACVPLAAGSWTSPDGGFQMYSFPDTKLNARAFLGNPKHADGMPAAQQELFKPQVAGAAGQEAAKGARAIRFLVMCGLEDERLPSSRAFAASLAAYGCNVETAWPQTPHGGRDKPNYRAEFQKYARTSVDFFQRTIRE